MRSSFPAAWLAAAALAIPLAVSAEDTKPYPECTAQPSEADTTAARGLFQAGSTSFNEGDYGKAIMYWEDAFKRDCTASKLLLNLARAYEASGNKKQTVVALETYVARVPNDPDRATLQRRIDRLKEEVAKAAPTAPAPTTTETPGPAPTGSDAPPPPPPGESRPMLPLYVAGGGAVLAVIGAAIYFPASADVSDFEAKCGANRTGCPDQKTRDDANSARSRANLGGLLAVGGVAIGVGGAVWYFLSAPEPASASARSPRRALAPRVDPAIGPGFVGLGVSGRF